MRGRTFAGGVGVLVVGLVIAGFGNSKPAVTEAKAAAMAGQTSALPKLTLTLTKSSITVGGSKQSGATNVVSTAMGLKEPLAILFLLKPTVSYADVEKYLKTKGAAKDPNTTAKYGSIVFDAAVTPGQANATQTYLRAGHYLALIPQEGKGPTPYTKFTVTAAKSPAALPRPEATIRSIEFAFRGPKTLHDGELVRFENAGFLVHMDIAAPVANMNSAKEAVKDLLAGKKKEKAFEKLIVGPPVGFAGPVSHEAFQQEKITAKPGIYVQVCFMETQDGRDHTLLGMERIIKITK